MWDMAAVIDKVIKRGPYNAPSNTAGLCFWRFMPHPKIIMSENLEITICSYY